MGQEYVSPEPVSTDVISTQKWRVLLALIMGILTSGVVFVILLSLGLTDPPRAGNGELLWQTTSAQDWQVGERWSEFQLYNAPLPLSAVPVTLELTASNNGTAASAWGISIETLEGQWTAIISNEGYLSVTTSSEPRWVEFLHIRPFNENKVYLHVETGGAATLRINDEIAWESHLALSEGASWGVVHYQQTQITWKMIAVYR
jgi:hypothetical protein